MKEQRFQEILVELERFNFGEALEMTRNCFLQHHKEKELCTCFEVYLRFDWHVASTNHRVEAEELIPLLENLPEEKRFCLSRVRIEPVVVYADAAGTEQQFKVRANTMVTGCGTAPVTISYDGAFQPHWQELRFRLDQGAEQVVPRSALSIGCTVAQTASGPLKVFAMDDNTLTMMVGTDAAYLVENREFLWDCFPGVKAGLYYDHDEYPALWSWLRIDEDTEGESTPWYCKHHTKKEELWEGMDFIDQDDTGRGSPIVKIKKIEDRRIILSLRSKDIVLDRPNTSEVIWEKGKHSLKAELYVQEPNKRDSWYFDYHDPVPTGCRVTLGIFREGAETPERTWTEDIRSTPAALRVEHYDGGAFWNWPYAWGFIGGKMVVGIKCPQYDNSRCTFMGLLLPGQEYTIPIDDNDPYEDRKTEHGRMTIRWETIEVGLEVVDGVLKSVPDQEALVVPAEAREMHYQALLTAPSLRKITIHQGMSKFSYALEEFHKRQNVKLDVVYEGSLQQWFDTASGLAGHIGRLVIQGKEYDFYNAKDLVIPEGVSRIGSRFFSYSEVIRSVVLPPEVVEVGVSAFAYCERLRKVKVLGPASIGASAFISCDDLSDIYLADGVVSLGTSCFGFLTKVESIFIPLSVTRVNRISEQNDGYCSAPKFYCAAPSKPSGWDENWNLSYYDPRFGLGHGYDYYHKAYWGSERKPSLGGSLHSKFLGGDD